MEYRDIKDATRLQIDMLDDDEKKLIKDKGCESATGVATPPGHPTQLDIWWLNDFTYVQPANSTIERDPWKLIGYVRPEDVAAEYMQRVHPVKRPPEDVDHQ